MADRGLPCPSDTRSGVNPPNSSEGPKASTGAAPGGTRPLEPTSPSVDAPTPLNPQGLLLPPIPLPLLAARGAQLRPSSTRNAAPQPHSPTATQPRRVQDEEDEKGRRVRRILTFRDCLGQGQQRRGWDRAHQGTPLRCAERRTGPRSEWRGEAISAARRPDGRAGVEETVNPC